MKIVISITIRLEEKKKKKKIGAWGPQLVIQDQKQVWTEEK